MSTAVIALEGVLSDSATFNMAMQRSPAGVEFYSSLGSLYRRVVLTHQTDYDKAAHWLRSQGLVDFDHLMCGYPEPMDASTQRTAQIRALRSSRTVLSLVVDIEAAAVAYASSTGSTGLLWVPARRGADRLDLSPSPIRSWEEMVPDDPRIPEPS